MSGDEIWYLYSCGGEGTILEHNPEHLHDEAKNVDQLIKTTNDIKVPLPYESDSTNNYISQAHQWFLSKAKEELKFHAGVIFTGDTPDAVIFFI